MNDLQKEIAARAIAGIVANAIEAKDRPSADALKTLAEEAAAAIAAGVKKFNEVA